MSVIVSRALPDVRDGLAGTPAHPLRRQGKRLRLEQAVPQVGAHRRRRHGQIPSPRRFSDLRRYGAHGAEFLHAADADRRTGQLRLHGRRSRRRHAYTEARLSRAAHALLEDFDKETVDFTENYDASTREPSVLPAQFPNLLVNGAGGIAVGMATNIPTHNLGEVIDACHALLKNPDISIQELMEHIPGPDFPTGGLIHGGAGIRAAYHTGRGSVVSAGAPRSRTLAATARPSSSPRSLPGEQVADDRAYCRGRTRQEGRGHIGAA